MKKNSPKKQIVVLYAPGLYPCKTGGMEIYNYNISKTMIQNFDNRNFFVLTECNRLIGKFKKFLPLKNRIFIVSRFGLGTLSTLIYYGLSNKLILDQNCTFLIPYTSNFTYKAIPFIILNKIYKFRYVIHIHGGGMKKWIPPWDRIQRYFFKNAYKVAGVSKDIVAEYSKRIEREVKYIAPVYQFLKNSKNIELFKKEVGLEYFDIIILYVGSLKSIKNPEILLKAFCRLDFEMVSVKKIGLVIIGDGPLKNSLEYYAKQMPHNKFIRILGIVPNEQIHRFYAVSDIFVLPSFYEGTSIALLEAMYNQLCCICSDIKGNSNIIESNKNGLLFNKNNCDELANKLQSLLLDEERRKIIGNNAYEYYKRNFDFGNHIQDLIEFVN